MNKCIENVKSLFILPSVEILADNLLIIFADPLLEQTIYNFVENSFQHGKHVTQIKITFSVGMMVMEYLCSRILELKFLMRIKREYLRPNLEKY